MAFPPAVGIVWLIEIAQETKQMFSSSHDQGNMARLGESNPLAIVSVVLSIIAVLVSLVGSYTYTSSAIQNNFERRSASGDTSVVSDESVFALVDRAFAFLTSNLISLVLSIAAAAIGLIALAGPKNTPAVIGLFLSVMLLLSFFFQIFT